MREGLKNIKTEKFNLGYVLLFFVIHILLILILLFHSESTYSEAFLWAASVVAVCTIPYLVAIASRQFALFEAVYLFLGGVIITFVLPLFFLGRLLDYDPGALARVMQYATLGCIAFLIGYWSGWAKPLIQKLPVKNFEIDEQELIKFPGKLYFLWIALYCSPWLHLESISPAFPFLISALTKLSISTALAIDIYLFAAPKTSFLRPTVKLRCITRGLFFFAVEIGRCFISGFSGPMFNYIVLMSLAYIKGKRKIPIAVPVFLVLTVMAFVTFITPFTKAFRSKYWYGATFNESVDYAFENISSEGVTQVQSRTLARGADALGVSVLITQLQSQGAKIDAYGSPADIIIRFIPRFLWPNKPATVDYNAIGHQLGILDPNDKETSIGIPLLGGFIINGGFFGVIIGMFIVGLILRTYWDWLIVKTGDNFLAFAIYLTLLFSWMFGGEDLPIFIHGNVAFLVYAYLFLGFIKRKKRRQ